MALPNHLTAVTLFLNIARPKSRHIHPYATNDNNLAISAVKTARNSPVASTNRQHTDTTKNNGKPSRRPKTALTKPAACSHTAGDFTKLLVLFAAASCHL